MKCSESKPTCSHCLRLGIECNWPAALTTNAASGSAPGSRPHSPAAAASVITAPSPSASFMVAQPQAQPELSINDLKLLHFWLVNTSITITVQDSIYMWQNVVVELGFRHHFLLHGILAVAATHKAGIFPSERDDLLLQSASHIEIGLRTFRTCLETPLPATCVPVFVMAGLLSIQNLGAAQANPPVDPIGHLCLWMLMVRGARSTVQQNWNLLRCSEISGLLLGHERLSDDTDEFVEMDSLKSLVEQVAQGATEREIYLDCVDQLRAVLLGVRCMSDRQQTSSMCSSWAATIHEGYRELLDQRQPLALVIVAHFATLFSHCRRIWCYRNWDFWIMNAVQSELPTEFEPWLDWPRKQISSTDSMTSSPSTLST